MCAAPSVLACFFCRRLTGSGSITTAGPDERLTSAKAFSK